MFIITHSDFLYSILPIVLLTNSYIPVTAHSDFSHSVSPIVLLTNSYSVLPIAAHSKSIGRLALSAKHSSDNQILNSGAILYIYYYIDLFNKIASILIQFVQSNTATLLVYSSKFIKVILLNSTSVILDLVLYILKIKLNILSIPRLLEYRARIAIT